MVAKRVQVSFLGTENVLKLIVVMMARFRNTLTATELYNGFKWVNCVVW